MKYSISEYIIEKSFYLSVWILGYFSDTDKLREKVDKLNLLDEGTLGKEIAKCLRKHNLSLVANFESHDLKHVLLNYKMNPIDEIRMQAFMIGNGNLSIPSVMIFLYGAILLPHKWNLFIVDFSKGKNAIPIKDWSIEEYANQDIDYLRETIYNSKEQKVHHMSGIRTFSQWASYAIIIAGIFGMLFCYPHLWSSNIADLVGAGFPFVAGAILIIGGLINLTLLSNKLQAII